MNHSHCLYLTRPVMNIKAMSLFFFDTFVFDMSACCVPAAGQCSQTWWMTLQWKIPLSRTWSLCFSPATPSAVSWQEACLSEYQPWHYSEWAFCHISVHLGCPSHFMSSTSVCRFAGYKAGACTHDEGVVTALIVLFSPVPIALLLIGMVFFRSYPINERQSLQLQESLATVQ